MHKYLVLLVFFFPGYSDAQSLFSSKGYSGHLCFVENKGSVTDQYGNERPSIQFKLRAGKGLDIFIESGALHYQFSKPVGCLNPSCMVKKPQRGLKGQRKELKNLENCKESQYDMYRMDMLLEGSNPNAELVCGQAIDYTEHNYHAGKENRVNAYDRVTYKDIYPKIDWVLYIRNNRLEYDFIVRPGGNPSDIKIRYDGASEFKVNEAGLMVYTPMGTVNERGLHSYIQENNRDVACSFKKEGNFLGFDIDNYNGTLVIDPTLEWGTYYGGIDESGILLAPGQGGSVYMAGYTTSPDNIATTGAFQTVYSGDDDAFLAKFDSNGAILWATYYGGSSVDQAFGLTSDSLGNAYISGLTSSTSGIATAGSHQSSYAGGLGDAFLAKFNSAGSRLWATYYGGSGTDLSMGVCTDKAGNVYLTGYTYSSDSIATPGSWKTSGGGGAFADGFIARFTQSGVLTWATYYGGNDDTQPVDIACDDSGNVYVAGTTSSTDSISTPGAFQHNFETFVDDDGFLAKFNSSGIRQWGTYYGANGSNELEQMTCDGSGNVYMTGSTSCTDSIATPGSFESALNGVADAFLVKFNTNGVIQWGTYFGTGADGANGVACDNSGNIFITGVTSDTSGIATTGAYQPFFSGGGDAFLAQFSSAGALIWATYYGGPNYEEGYGVACDGHGNIFMSGNTKSLTGIATPGAYDTVYTAESFGNNAFLTRFGPHAYNPSAVKPVALLATDFEIFPNPANNWLNVSWKNTTAPVISLVIRNLAGLQMYSGVFNHIWPGALIPVNTFPAGIYECEIQCGADYFNHLFVVSR